MGFDKEFYDLQSDTRTAGCTASGFVGAVEAFKYIGKIFVGDTDTGVFYGYNNRPRRLLGPDHDGSAFRRIFECIGD